MAPPETQIAAPRKRQHAVCAASELAPGERRIVSIDGRKIGVFNVGGRFYALHNGCPHKGGPLCEGALTGMTLPSDDYTFQYGREGEIVRCGWHGLEFDIATGQAIAEPTVRARTYPVSVEDGQLVVTL